MLVENTKRNIPHTAEVEAQQKMALSAALVRFLVAASGPADGAPPDAPPVWPTAVSMMQEHTATQSMLEVMRNEDRYGDPHATLWLEHTALGSQVASLLTSLPDLSITGPLKPRVLTRIAELFEGNFTPVRDNEGLDSLEADAAAGGMSQTTTRRTSPPRRCSSIKTLCGRRCGSSTSLRRAPSGGSGATSSTRRSCAKTARSSCFSN